MLAHDLQPVLYDLDYRPPSRCRRPRRRATASPVTSRSIPAWAASASVPSVLDRSPRRAAGVGRESTCAGWPVTWRWPTSRKNPSPPRSGPAFRPWSPRCAPPVLPRATPISPTAPPSTAGDLAGCNLVRPGISLYGGLTGTPFEAVVPQRPVMRFVSQVAQLKVVPAGEGISYAHRFVTLARDADRRHSGRLCRRLQPAADQPRRGADPRAARAGGRHRLHGLDHWSMSPPSPTSRSATG